MKYTDITDLLEEQGINVFKQELQSCIQHTTSAIEEKCEYLEANGYEDNEDMIEAVLYDTLLLIRKLRKKGVIV